MEPEEFAEFMAHISHDLKTPLNAVVGFVSVLQQMQSLNQDATAKQSSPKATASEAEGQRYLHLVHRAAGQLLERIDAMVLMFRLQAGLIRQAGEWLTPRQLLLHCAEGQQEAASAKDISIVLGPEPAAARVRSDSKLVQIVLRELVANAVRFGQVGRVTLQSAVEPGTGGMTQVAFTVSDSGPGLSGDEARLVGASLQGDGLAGLGLGLALCRAIARLLDGRIELVRSAPDGTTLALVLQLAQDAVQAQSA